MKNLFKDYSRLHLTLAATIIFIGCLALGLVLISDMAYKNLAIKQQKSALQNLLSIKSKDFINELIQHQKELGYVLQSEKIFTDSFNNRDQKELRYWLDQEFNRYYATTGLIKLEKLLVYDTDFKLVSLSARGIAMSQHGKPPCASLIRNMSQLPLAEHLRPRSELCLFDNKPLLSTIVSIGSLPPKGYIQIVSDPVYNLTNIEDKLGIELKISTYDNTILHQSRNWPDNSLTEETLLTGTHVVLSNDSSPLLVISGIGDTQTFYNDLQSTAYKVIAATVFIILSALIIALAVLNNSLLPLRKLRSAAIEINKGNFSTVSKEDQNEITEPFNKAVARIEVLTKNLGHEIGQHRIIEEKLNQAIKQAEDNALTAENHRNILRMTLQSVIDGVITTDTLGQVTYINPIAERLTGWSETDAQGKPLDQVFHAVDKESRERISDPAMVTMNNSALDEPVSAILIHHKDQVETPVEYVATPMLDTKGNLTGNVIIIHDESAQRSLNRQLIFQASCDALTGLPNRYEFERKLKQLVAAVSDESGMHTLCYLDIDEFRLINDTYGHSAGDELLKQFAALLNNIVHEKHILARIGKDKFGLLLENCDITQSRPVINNIFNAIDQYNFIWDTSSSRINVSIGITTFTAGNASCEQLLSNVNSACLLAKEDGRDRLQIYTSEDNNLLTQQREMHWVSRINHALEEDRFQLYYHEILPLQENSKRFMRHGEVLLRMVNKQGELVSPNMFLPAARRYGMLGVIDEWVVQKTIEWLSEGNKKVAISMNISGYSISSNSFLNFVVTSLIQSKINPELLCFEITESVAIKHLSAAIHFMTVLKKLGCKFSLDDFGSGLSSFSYLTSLPVDYLKIDGTFVVDIDKDPMHYAMVKSINEVGHVMGIKTIAEYAASDAIIDCLREIGVDNAQGYAIARPVPLSSFKDGDAEKTGWTSI